MESLPRLVNQFTQHLIGLSLVRTLLNLIALSTKTAIAFRKHYCFGILFCLIQFTENKNCITGGLNFLKNSSYKIMPRRVQDSCFFSCEGAAQHVHLSLCVSVRLSVSKLNFCLFNPLSPCLRPFTCNVPSVCIPFVSLCAPLCPLCPFMPLSPLHM